MKFWYPARRYDSVMSMEERGGDYTVLVASEWEGL